MNRWMLVLGAIAMTGCGFHDGCDDDPCGRDGERALRLERRRPLGRDDDCPVDLTGNGSRADAGGQTVVDAGATDATASPRRCALDRDCAAAGAGLVCDVRSGACVAPAQCTADAQCASGEVCLAGRCLGPTAVCQFASDCGAGRDCVDGRCLAGCGAASACPPSQACVGGYCVEPTTPGGQCARATDCAAGSVCADGRCVAACSTATPCGAGEACVAGFCRADTAPRRFCERDSECAAGSVCRRGSCRAACPRGTVAECLRVDVAFDTCGPDLLCTNPLELRPECARAADCTAPATCINARCR